MDERNENLGGLLGHCGRLVRQEMERNLRAYLHSITSVQCFAMGHILKAEEQGRTLSQRDLERELKLAAPTVNGVVERLEQRGYLRRQQSPTDGRCKLLFSTEQARELKLDFDRAAQKTEQQLLRGMSAGEQETLWRLLRQIEHNLQEVRNG